MLLGDIFHGDTREVRWGLSWNSEGTKTVSADLESTNVSVQSDSDIDQLFTDESVQSLRRGDRDIVAIRRFETPNTSVALFLFLTDLERQSGLLFLPKGRKLLKRKRQVSTSLGQMIWLRKSRVDGLTLIRLLQPLT